MKKQFNNNKNNLIPYCEYEALVKSFLNTFSMEIQDRINSRLIHYRQRFLSLFSAFQIQLKNQSKSFWDSLKKTTKSLKIKFNKCSVKDRKDIISLFYKKYDLYKNIIDGRFNEFEDLISLIQTERCGILKDIDEISISCNNQWKSLLPNDSKEYQKNIGVPISKFRDEMNSMLKRLFEKISQEMTSHQNTLLSFLELFEEEMNEIINFRIGK